MRSGGGQFGRLWLASGSANLADGFVLAALPLLAVALTRDPRLVAGLTVAATLPWLLLSVPLGAVVDRYDRSRLMVVANIMRAIVATLLALAVALGAAPLAVLYAAAFVLGCGEVLFDSAAQAVVPTLVDADRLEQANGRLWSTEVAANYFAGPSIGGVAFALLAALPFAATATLYAAGAGLLATLRQQPVSWSTRHPTAGVEAARPPRARLRTELGEAARWLRAQPLLRRMAAMVVVLAFLDAAGQAVLVLLAVERFGLGEAGYGLMLAFGLGGAVVGASVAARLRRRYGVTTTLTAVVGVLAVAQGGLGLARNPVQATTSLAVAAAAAGVWKVVSVSLRQQLVPQAMQGRVGGLYRLVGTGAMPLGAVTGGLLAAGVGLSAPYLVAVPAFALVALAARGLGEPPAATSDPASPASDLTGAVTTAGAGALLPVELPAPAAVVGATDVQTQGQVPS